MNSFDVIIVGGGINGCGLLRDLALQGASALLLDKGDFSSQTSQGSSKMLHGGLRYLENLDFALVQEALREKNLWLKLTPHLCFEREFILPLYRYSKYRPFMLKTGLMVYDFLSHFQNKPHQMLSAKQTLLMVPSLADHQLLGSGKYFDAIVDDAKLSLECLYDALLEPKIRAESYHEVIATEKINDGYVVSYRCVLTKKIFSAKAKFLVFTTGPFTDELLPKLAIPWRPKLLPSKGIHLWLKKNSLETKTSVVLTTKEGRVVFVNPQREALLVGTTETPVNEDMFNIKAHSAEVNYLLAVLNEYFPRAKVDESSIISTYAAVRPLISEEGNRERGKVSRFHKIFRPDESAYVLVGGKYTTFRAMTEELAREIIPRLGRSYRPNLTLKPLRQKSLIPTFGKRPFVDLEMIKEIIRKEKVTTFEDLVHRRLSLLENTSELTHVFNIPVEKITALF